MAGIGDINGDGIDDLAVGSDWFNETYAVFGAPHAASARLELSHLQGIDGFKTAGFGHYDRNGYSVASAGDINGDGFGDFIVGVASARFNARNYVVFGHDGAFPAALNESDLDGTRGFEIKDNSDFGALGAAVASAGDINGDGYGDLIIGATHTDTRAGQSAGTAFVLFGHAGSFAAQVNVDTLNGTDGFWLDGAAGGDCLARSVAGAGDINGDGFDDLLIGAYAADPGGRIDAGAAYVVYGGDFRHEVTVLGGAQDELLTGTNGDDILIGGLGNDSLRGGAGADVLRGGQGDDAFFFDAADRAIVGGAGHDTLRFEGSGEQLDLGTTSNLRYQGIEHIDLTGSGDNQLILTLRDVLALPDGFNGYLANGTRQLLVDGDSGDRVDSVGEGWVAGTPLELNGSSYVPYSHARVAALLLIDTAVTQNIT